MKEPNTNSHIIPVAYNGNVFANKSQLARAFGAKPRTFGQRLRMGLSIEESLNLNRKARLGLGCYLNGKVFKNITELAIEYQVSADALRARLKNGWPLEQALELKERTIKFDSRSLVVNDVIYRSIKDVAFDYEICPKELQFRFDRDRCIESAVSSIYNSFYSPFIAGSMTPIFFNRKIYPSVNLFINDLINKGAIRESSLLNSLSVINNFIENNLDTHHIPLSQIAKYYALDLPSYEGNFSNFIDELHKRFFGHKFNMLFHSEMPFILSGDGLAVELGIADLLW